MILLLSIKILLMISVYQHTILTMLVHVTEHFSYHTGQIAWITKMLTDEDLGFYAGEDLG